MKKILVFGTIMPALFLAGCGDGWEARLYDGFPYGNARTAGHGIEYVRVNLMPEKGPVIKAATPENEIIIPESDAEPELAPAPVVQEEKNAVDRLINSGEKFFRDMQRK